MRLPYLQIDMEVVEKAAPDIAVVLGKDEAKVGWGLVKLFRWAISNCPEDKPPSESAVIPDEKAVELIAGAAGFSRCAPEFVYACMRVGPDPVLQKVDGGIRICGLKRYDAAWRRRGKRNAETTASEPNRDVGETPSEPERSAVGTGAEPERNRQQPEAKPKAPESESELKTEEKEDVRRKSGAPPPEGDNVFELKPTPNKKSRRLSVREQFYVWARKLRAEEMAYWEMPEEPDAEWGEARINKQLDFINADNCELFCDAYRAFLQDESKKDKPAPRWPMWMFVQDRHKYLPPGPRPAGVSG